MTPRSLQSETSPQGDAPLRGRRALVTGGGAGIGAEIARDFSARGAHVIVADRDEVSAVSLAREIEGTAWVVDLADPSVLADASFGGRLRDVDILVNNAGIQRVAAIEDFDTDAFRYIIRLMLEAPFLLIRAALPGMYERRFGRIVNISSVHGLRASPFKSAYVTAKHGLEGLSKTAALEGGPRGVTSNCVNPGYVRTALVEQQLVDQAAQHGIPESEVLEKVMLTESAIARLVEPREVASLVGWLTSDHAAMVTGASYTMDGGWSAR